MWRGQIYYIYNHFDSYWEGLGVSLLLELFEALMKDPSLQSWKDQVDSRTDYPWSEPPQINDSDPFADMEYDSLPRLKPTIANFFKTDLPLDPSIRMQHRDVFIEFIYTINLDEEVFEVVGYLPAKVDKDSENQDGEYVFDRFIRFRTILEQHEEIAKNPLAFLTTIEQTAVKSVHMNRPLSSE